MSGVETLIATIPDPDLEIMDFFEVLAEEFEMNKTFASKGEFLLQFREFLLESYGADKKVLLIIDEAQRLNHELLEQVRLLSNIEMDHRKLINIFFVGQSEFNDMLKEEKNRAMRQRIAVNYELKPLTASETTQYIRHRLMLAGALDDVFKPDAVREVFTLSRGYPRLINIICDYALMAAYSAGLKQIGSDMIKECGRELQITIGIDKIEKEQSNPFQPVKPSEAAASREKPHRSIMLGFAFIMLVFVFVGYHVFGSMRESPPRWAVEEFAPKKENLLLDKQREAFKAEIEASKITGEDQQAAIQDRQEEPQTKITAEASQMEESNKDEEVLEAKSPQIDSTEAQPPAFIADQKSIIYFEHNSNELPNKAYTTLDNIVKSTMQRSDLKITVEGYTDSLGDPVYNRQLSKYRADMVKNYLIGHGISPENIAAIGRGPENPINSNSTFEGRKHNRRVEIMVKKIR
jgi:general secretion pathway protein A